MISEALAVLFFVMFVCLTVIVVAGTGALLVGIYLALREASK